MVLDLLGLHYTAHQFRDPRGSHTFQKSFTKNSGVSHTIQECLIHSRKSPTQSRSLSHISRKSPNLEKSMRHVSRVSHTIKKCTQVEALVLGHVLSRLGLLALCTVPSFDISSLTPSGRRLANQASSRHPWHG